MSKEIHVKTHKRWFCMWISRKKSFEIRNNDRNYERGDRLFQHEIDETTGEETGRVGIGDVGYVLHEQEFPAGLKPGYVVVECPFLKMCVKPKQEGEQYGY